MGIESGRSAEPHLESFLGHFFSWVKKSNDCITAQFKGEKELENNVEVEKLAAETAKEFLAMKKLLLEQACKKGEGALLEFEEFVLERGGEQGELIRRFKRELFSSFLNDFKTGELVSKSKEA